MSYAATTNDLPPPGNTSPPDAPPTRLSRFAPFIMPMLTLGIAYGLLFLTLTTRISHSEMMARCVLADESKARIWSVANVEIGLAYFGVFGAMLFYFLKIYRNSISHLRDLSFALAYLFGSFLLDYFCVEMFEPFIAMLVGDALVMTFTLIISRQVWFQRLLGVFVPLIFLTCGIGHFLEGLSYWYQTYHLNVPWTMVTADIGFAVLVNASRYPAFIRGEDILTELTQQTARAEELAKEVGARLKAEAENLRLLDEVRQTNRQQGKFLRDVLASVTKGRLRFCHTDEELPPHPDKPFFQTTLASGFLRDLRSAIGEAMRKYECDEIRIFDTKMAVGEVAMNAINHANGGTATVYVDDTQAKPMVQVWIEDNGKGISLDSLPRAALEAGYSSAGTLGQGFHLMLRTADVIWIRTTPTGTTIVIEQGIHTVADYENYANAALIF